MDQPFRLTEAGAPVAPPPEHQWGLPGKEDFPGEEVGAYHQTPARSTKLSNLGERLHCICRGANSSLSFGPQPVPSQRPLFPWPLCLPPGP
jgi:hypothetical protein